MPLKCLRGDEEIYAFDVESDKAWDGLRRANAVARDLKMPCCGAEVVLRISPLGTRHFTHKRKGPCETAPETKEHLLAKRLVVDGIRRTKWAVKPEQDGETPSGDKWKADVLATTEKTRVAFEIQWSRQDFAETRRRQARYVASGVRGLWLFRQTDFPVADQTCPAFRLVFDEAAKHFSVWMPSRFWHPDYAKPEARDSERYWSQRIELSRFAEGAVSGKLRFAPTLGSSLPMEVRAAFASCWRCKKRTRLVLEMVIVASRVFPSHPDIHLSIRSLDQISGGVDLMARWLPKHLLRRYGIGEIKVRESSLDLEGRASYLSNGCVSCGAMQTRWLEEMIDDVPEMALTVPVIFDQSWADQLPGKRDWRLWWFNES